eukprot:sb/3472589/
MTYYILHNHLYLEKSRGKTEGTKVFSVLELVGVGAGIKSLSHLGMMGAISHQQHLPITPQQPAPSPVVDNTAHLLQLQTQIQQAAQQVQVLGQQAASVYTQAQNAPTNELRNQYYQQYTQMYQQQQQHQQQHNTLVSQHTALLRGGTPSATSTPGAQPAAART